MDAKIVSGIWWSLVVRGVLAILFGIVAFFYTGQTLVALVYVFGVFALLSGIATIIAAVRAGESHQRWGWLAASGLIGVAAGVVSFVWPTPTAQAFVYLVAAWAIPSGVLEIAFALALPDTLAHPFWAAFSGALSVLFGVLLAVWPKSGETALIWLVGVYAIVHGITLLYYAYLIQGLRGDVRAMRQAARRHASEQVQGHVDTITGRNLAMSSLLPLLARRRVRPRILALASSLLFLTLAGVSSHPAAAKSATVKQTLKPTIVLLHGAWADSSSWSKEVAELQGDGYTVAVPPNPLRGLPADAAYLADFLQTIPGPVVLVGNSYGGAVITDAATGNRNVKALVFVDAFIPDASESVFGLSSTPPPPGQPGSCLGGNPANVFNFVPYPGAPANDVDLYIKSSPNPGFVGFAACFANDLPLSRAAVLSATQRPIAFSALTEPSGAPAWKTIPSWAVVGALDRVIPPFAQLAMAQRAHAQITEVAGSHLALISQADAVTQVIETAASATS
jgi:uncharacterized membrane protein HdeD (DUF308 family)/pimeloyl-ACP methyl ester carboxylesterase